MVSKALSLIVAVGGGKGGVGKSVVSANLGVAMAHMGLRVAIVDVDLGAANQHTLFGIDRPGATLHALIEGRVRSLEEVVQATAVKGLFLVPGSGAEYQGANIGHGRKLKLIRHIQALQMDAVIVDCGAGVGFNALDFFIMADQRLLVASPQLVSLHNAYSFLKGAVLRALRQLAINEREGAVIDRSLQGGEGERVAALLDKVGREDERLAQAMRRCVEHFGVSLLANQMESAKQSQVLRSLARMAHDFLGLDVPLRGALMMDAGIHASVTRRKPYLADATQQGPARDAFFQLAEALLSADVSAIRNARRRTLSESQRPLIEESEGEAKGPLTNYLRRDPRALIAHKVHLSMSGAQMEALLFNLSASGAAVETSVHFPLGSKVELQAQCFLSAPLRGSPQRVGSGQGRRRHGVRG